MYDRLYSACASSAFKCLLIFVDQMSFLKRLRAQGLPPCLRAKDPQPEAGASFRG